MHRCALASVLTAMLAACGGQTAVAVNQDRGEGADDVSDSGLGAGSAAAVGIASDAGRAPSPSRVDAASTPKAPAPEPTAEPEPVPELDSQPEAGPQPEPEPASATPLVPEQEPEPRATLDAGPDGGSDVVDPGDLATEIQRYWSVGGYIGQVGEEETFWRFLAAPDFEYVRLTNFIPDGVNLHVDPGTYSLEGRSLSLEYAYHRYVLDVAVGTIAARPTLMTRVYLPLGESSFRTEFAEESLLEDGTRWRAVTVSNELTFDAPIPREGSGDCTVQAEYWVEAFELLDGTGVELPEDERTTRESGLSPWIPCHYEPSDQGQRIQLAEPLFEQPPTIGASQLALALRQTLWFAPEPADVLFATWVSGRDELPEHRSVLEPPQ